MWIRSQDKTHLMDTKHIGLVQFDVDVYSIIAHDATKHGSVPDVLGDYDTEEEALKVIDEIHNIIASDGKLNDCTFRVYQIPQKGRD